MVALIGHKRSWVLHPLLRVFHLAVIIILCNAVLLQNTAGTKLLFIIQAQIVKQLGEGGNPFVVFVIHLIKLLKPHQPSSERLYLRCPLLLLFF